MGGDAEGRRCSDPTSQGGAAEGGQRIGEGELQGGVEIGEAVESSSRRPPPRLRRRGP